MPPPLHQRDGFPVDVGSLPPRCPQCGGLLKSDTVMFGEPIPGDVTLTCGRAVEACDCTLLVGTSASVYPAAGLAWPGLAWPGAHSRTAGVWSRSTPRETDASAVCEVSIRARSSKVLPLLAERLGS